ncbi:MAG: hypothetical protein AAF430_18375 [Myxococcota bacterium]
MDSPAALLGFVFCLWGLVEIRDSFRVRGWTPVKAQVVHWHQASPFGSQVSRPTRHETLVVRPDGSETVIVSDPANDPEISYFAEMVYFVEGTAFAADLTFPEPVGDSYEILVNPENPSQYDLPPDLVPPIVHLAFGLAAFAI